MALLSGTRTKKKESVSQSGCSSSLSSIVLTSFLAREKKKRGCQRERQRESSLLDSTSRDRWTTSSSFSLFFFWKKQKGVRQKENLPMWERIDRLLILDHPFFLFVLSDGWLFFGKRWVGAAPFHHTRQRMVVCLFVSRDWRPTRNTPEVTWRDSRALFSTHPPKKGLARWVQSTRKEGRNQGHACACVDVSQARKKGATLSWNVDAPNEIHQAWRYLRELIVNQPTHPPIKMMETASPVQSTRKEGSIIIIMRSSTVSFSVVKMKENNNNNNNNRKKESGISQSNTMGYNKRMDQKSYSRFFFH